MSSRSAVTAAAANPSETDAYEFQLGEGEAPSIVAHRQAGSPLKPKKRWIRESSSTAGSDTAASASHHSVAGANPSLLLSSSLTSIEEANKRKRNSSYIAASPSASSDNGASGGGMSGGGIRLKFSSKQNGSYAVQMVDEAALDSRNEAIKACQSNNATTNHNESNLKHKRKPNATSSKKVESSPAIDHAALALIPVGSCRLVGEMSLESSSKQSMLRVGDVVWAKLTGWPWWPGRVAGLQCQTEPVDSATADQCIACIHWFNWDQVSYLPADRLRLFVDYYAKLFDTKKKGAYKTAVEQAYLIAHAPPADDDCFEDVGNESQPKQEADPSLDRPAASETAPEAGATASARRRYQKRQQRDDRVASRSRSRGDVKKPNQARRGAPNPDSDEEEEEEEDRLHRRQLQAQYISAEGAAAAAADASYCSRTSTTQESHSAVHQHPSYQQQQQQPHTALPQLDQSDLGLAAVDIPTFSDDDDEKPLIIDTEAGKIIEQMS